MRSIRHGRGGKEKPGLLGGDGLLRCAEAFGKDHDECFFESDGIGRFKEWSVSGCTPILGEDERLRPPMGRPSKIVCVGLNYAAHAKENEVEAPEQLVFLFKSTSSVGPYDKIQLPKGGAKTDWEVELAVVIQKITSYASKEEALSVIVGYLLHNGYFERSFQLERGGQLVKGKSCDTFAPIGPFLATPYEVNDPHDLKLSTKTKGQTMQSSNTADLIFDIPTLVSYISQFMTLFSGDVISTGTPEGVGLGQSRLQYLTTGDVVEVGVESLGTSSQEIVDFNR